MTVGELINILQVCPKDATIRLTYTNSQNRVTSYTVLRTDDLELLDIKNLSINYDF